MPCLHCTSLHPLIMCLTSTAYTQMYCKSFNQHHLRISDTGSPLYLFTREGLVHKYISPISCKKPSWELEFKRFSIHTANCLLHKLKTFNAKLATYRMSQMQGMYSQIDLSTKKKQQQSNNCFNRVL